MYISDIQLTLAPSYYYTTESCFTCSSLYFIDLRCPRHCLCHRLGAVGAGAVWRIECSVEGWRGAVALMHSLIAPFQLSTGRGRTVPARRPPGPRPMRIMTAASKVRIKIEVCSRRKKNKLL